MRKIRYVDLYELYTIMNQEDDDLKKSYFKISDSGYDNEDGSHSFSLDEMQDVATFYGELCNALDKNNRFKDSDVRNFVLGYRAMSSGLDEQFDILKYGDKQFLNIELKSKLPSKKAGADGLTQVKNQLKRHQLYLSTHKDTSVYEYCFVIDQNTLYKLDNDELKVTSMADLHADIIKLSNLCNDLPALDISSMLISPYTEPHKFASHRYFLTQQQFEAKTQIIHSYASRVLLTGKAGSGKTLVGFDIAKSLSTKGKRVQLIFCAKMTNAEIISSVMGFNVVPINELTIEDILNFDFDVIIVDEAQRAFQSKIDALLSLNNTRIIFSYDLEQSMHIHEKKIDFKKDDTYLEINLKGKIRQDKELSSFINKLIKGDRSQQHPYDYDKISLQYAKNKEWAKELVNRKTQFEDYVSIEMTPYVTKTNGYLKHQMIYSGSKTAHDVIGREYDNIVVLIDDKFGFDSNGMFGASTEYYPYLEPEVLLEILTRVRKRLLFVVVNNNPAYEYIQQILTWNDDKRLEFSKVQKKESKEKSLIAQTLKDDKECQREFLKLCEELNSFSNKYNFDRTTITQRALKEMDKVK